MAPSPDTCAEQTKAAQKAVQIVGNPTASRFSLAKLERLAELLRAQGANVCLHMTERSGEIARFSADSNADVLVIAGGDSSINEAAATLKERRGGPTLAIVPFGTGNSICRDLRLPQTIEDIASAICKGNTTNLYNGIANGRAFFVAASVGFDAEIVHLMPFRMKRRLGKFAYMLLAARLLLERTRTRLKVEADGVRYNCGWAMICNTGYYAGFSRLAVNQNGGHAGLTLIMVQRDTPLNLLRVFKHMVFGRGRHSPYLKQIPIENARITCRTGAAVQVDGEPFGMAPLVIDGAPNALPVIGT
ncbi:diacylglycerol/lipid kinase family protein [Polycladidibacter hongkongensis]|uniref:diacylglycerol/lipid kinase family protein n=1 Tax=Polycladidibacter hongkongensis TaxID=1647556 RepID=UPI00082DFF86|nr:diacylglycerol kinase family protein [Pseudovibrio hongkongensis]